MASESSKGKLATNKGYVVVAFLAIVLVWTTDLLEIISVASRAFAVYYLLQCFVAMIASRHHHDGTALRLNRVRFTTLAVILAFIVIFAIPAE